jgi:hypothetical protein
MSRLRVFEDLSPVGHREGAAVLAAATKLSAGKDMLAGMRRGDDYCLNITSVRLKRE